MSNKLEDNVRHFSESSLLESEILSENAQTLAFSFLLGMKPSECREMQPESEWSEEQLDLYEDVLSIFYTIKRELTSKAERKKKTVCYESMLREVKPGDTIVCKGIKAVVKDIMYQDFYKDTSYELMKDRVAKETLPRDTKIEDRSSIILEFHDESGKYRNWKSYDDGGYVIYNNIDDYVDDFKKRYYNTGKELKEVVEEMRKTYTDLTPNSLLKIILIALGNQVWED